MVKYSIQARNVQNVAASKTALIDLPVGKRYHYVQLQHGFASGTNTAAGAAVNISEVRVKVNGRVQRVYSGVQLSDLNLLNGAGYGCTGVPNTAPGVSFPIYFYEPWRTSAQQREALAWETTGWQSFQIEVDLGAASTPTLVAHCIVDDFASGKLPADRSIVKQLRFSSAAPGSSYDIATIDRRDFLTAVSFYPDSGASNAFTKVTLRLNGTIVHELTATANVARNTQYAMTPAASGRTANIYDLVLDHDDDLGSALNMNGVRDATITLDAGGTVSGTVTYIVERIGPPE